MGTWVMVAGILADLVGFLLIGWEHTKRGSDRIIFHGNAARTSMPDFWGFVLVVAGFTAQLGAQTVAALGH